MVSSDAIVIYRYSIANTIINEETRQQNNKNQSDLILNNVFLFLTCQNKCDRNME